MTNGHFPRSSSFSGSADGRLGSHSKSCSVPSSPGASSWGTVVGAALSTFLFVFILLFIQAGFSLWLSATFLLSFPSKVAWRVGDTGKMNDYPGRAIWHSFICGCISSSSWFSCPTVTSFIPTWKYLYKLHKCSL